LHRSLYTGVLALAFAAASHPLPFRALFAAFLLGLSIALSTAFLAYLPDPDESDDGSTAEPAPAELSASDARVRTYILWTLKTALGRGYALWASVLALAAALFFLPAPFVQKRAAQTTLRRILYAAEVKETADARHAPIADQGNDTFWWIAFGTAFAIVFTVPLVKRNPSNELGGLTERSGRS